MDNLTGSKLGVYQIIERLGEGGMATVYKAYQPAVDRYVAIKVLPRQLAEDASFVARFKQEALVLARLQHPNIVPVFDFGETDGYAYIVMPLINGGTLEDLLHGQPLPPWQVNQIMYQVGYALDYAHKKGLIHRDIKPANILIDEGGNFLLSDFGIARIMEGTTRITMTGKVVGTPAYMSPEQGSGESIDPRSDIYSLGVVLYELVTGRVPFHANTPLAVIYQHVYEALPPARSFNPGISEALEYTIEKALAKSPADRFSSAAEFTQAVLGTAEPERQKPWNYSTVEVAAQPATPTVDDHTAIHSIDEPIFSETWVHQPHQFEKEPRKQAPKWIITVGAVALLVAIGAIALAAFPEKLGAASLNPKRTVTNPVKAAINAPESTSAILTSVNPTTTRPATAISFTSTVTSTALPFFTKTIPSPTLPPTLTFTPPATLTPTKLSIETISYGSSVKGTSLQVTRIGSGPQSLVIAGGIHGSEYNTSQLVDSLLKRSDDFLKAVGQTTTLYLIPRINPDGAALDSVLNAHQVDLNRNWSTKNWKSAATGPYGTNVSGTGGARPFSEPETAALSNWLLDLKKRSPRPVVAISYHSSTPNGVVQPSYQVQGTPDPNADPLAKLFASLTGYIYTPTWTYYTITGEFINWCGENNLLCLDVELPDRNSPSNSVVQMHYQAILELMKKLAS